MSEVDPFFERALSVVLSHEGGFVNNKNDPGGATNFGISLRWLQETGRLDTDGDGYADGDLNLDGHIDIADIKLLTTKDAGLFYRRGWWDKFGYADLQLLVAIKTFDLAVNMGGQQAHKVLQRACRACGRPIDDDGVLGPKTKAVVQALPPSSLLPAMRSEAAGFYRGLVAAKPTFNEFIGGWLNRAYA